MCLRSIFVRYVVSNRSWRLIRKSISRKDAKAQKEKEAEEKIPCGLRP